MNIFELLKKKYPEDNVLFSCLDMSGGDLQYQFSMVIWHDEIPGNQNPNPKPTWEEFSADPIVSNYISNETVINKRDEVWQKVKEYYSHVLNVATVKYLDKVYQADQKSILLLSAAVCNGEQSREWLDVDNNRTNLTHIQLKELVSIVNNMTETNFLRKEALRSSLNAADTVVEIEDIETNIKTLWAENPFISQ
jgi:hypothetical protein